MPEASIGVVILTFNSGLEAVDCAETLFASAERGGVPLQVALVDNASTDDTVKQLRAWASGERPYQPPPEVPFPVQPIAKPLALVEGGPGLAASASDAGHQVALIETGENRGFAGGVNVGLAYLAQFPGVKHFWVLNPDSLVAPDSVANLTNRLASVGDYGLMGGRVNYLDPPGLVQIDGGLINWKTGVTSNFNIGQPITSATPPTPAELDFITGASMVASRDFYEQAGPMREDYFLYYEEVDWAMRRGDLPFAYCQGLEIYHRAGTSIGSPTLNRPATPFSQYFKHRSRIRFLRHFRPGSLPFAYLYSLAYTVRMLLLRAWPEAWAVVTGSLGLKAPAAIRNRLGPAAAKLAFGPASGPPPARPIENPQRSRYC